MSTADQQQAPYVRIAGHYRDQIRTGAVQPGQRLPTVREIAETWGVARQTADKALATLRAEGLTLTAGRGGTIVAPQETTTTVTIAVDEPAGFTIASADVAKASDAVARELGVQPGSTVVVVRLVADQN